MAKNKDGGGGSGEGAVRGGAGGQQPIITWFHDSAGPKRESERDTEGQGERKRVREGKTGTERERESGWDGWGGRLTHI